VQKTRIEKKKLDKGITKRDSSAAQAQSCPKKSYISARKCIKDIETATLGIQVNEHYENKKSIVRLGCAS
jgi:hypothetical protein